MEPFVMGPSGRPPYTEHEVERQAFSNLKVILNQSGENTTSLVRLTNFRLVFQQPISFGSHLSESSPSPHKYIHLSNIKHFEVGKSFLFWKSTTIKLILYPTTQNSNSSENIDEVTLEFSPEQINKFIEDLSLQMERKSWLHYPLERDMNQISDSNATSTSTPSSPSMLATSTYLSTNTMNQPKQEFSTSRAGISGLARTMEEKNKAVGESLQDAFKDLDTLFENAQQMVLIANRLSSLSNSASSDKNVMETGDEHFQSDLMHLMGIRSPVTLGGHDNWDIYCEELSRELDLFVNMTFDKLRSKNASTSIIFSKSISNLANSNQIRSEVIPLTDLYCIFNRARGTALVSPEDLYQACQRLAPLKLKSRMIELNDGVLAVASDSYDEEKIAIKVSEILKEMGPMSAVQLATQQTIALPLSSHYLSRAENMGLVCRDDSSEGLIFWPNIFEN